MAWWGATLVPSGGYTRLYLGVLEGHELLMSLGRNSFVTEFGPPPGNDSREPLIFLMTHGQKEQLSGVGTLGANHLVFRHVVRDGHG